jgi:N-acetylmuramoyl-L-alanine amidase
MGYDNRLKFLFLGIALFFLCASSHAGKRVFRVFIDPGHTPRTDQTRGIIGEEQTVNYKVARLLESRLRGDRRFSVALSRDAVDYSENIRRTLRSHRTLLYGFAETVVPREIRTAQLGTDDLAELYAVRATAIDKRYDILLSIHFDYAFNPSARYEDVVKGFHVTASPFNRRFDESFSDALEFRNALAANYSPNTNIDFDWKYLAPATNLRYDFKKLSHEGLNVRSLIILGDVFEKTWYEREKMTPKADIPSVLVECGFLHEKKFLDQNELARLADCLYRALVVIADASNIKRQ